jgi:hypothetical protein
MGDRVCVWTLDRYWLSVPPVERERRGGEALAGTQNRKRRCKVWIREGWRRLEIEDGIAIGGEWRGLKEPPIELWRDGNRGWGIGDGGQRLRRSWDLGEDFNKDWEGKERAYRTVVLTLVSLSLTVTQTRSLYRYALSLTHRRKQNLCTDTWLL